MIIVSNSSPLAALAAVSYVDLLPKLYGKVCVPDAVWYEVVERGIGKPGVAELKRADWLERHSISNTDLAVALQDSLDVGEAEAIALALDLRADLLLMDERIGRRVAQRLGLRVTGVIGVLVEAKHNNLIQSIKPMLNKLRDEAGFRLSDELYQQVLTDEGE